MGPRQADKVNKPRRNENVSIHFTKKYLNKFQVLADKNMGERYNIHSQLEHLQSKYIGTGHADTTKYEWATNQHRDTYASYMGHFDMMNYFSIAENESKARVRFNLMEKMIQPCGPPPEKKAED